MSKGTKIIGLIIGTTIAAAIYGLGVFVGPGVWIGFQVSQAQTRLLCETDHQALLETCRELSRQTMDKEFKGVVYDRWKVRKLPEPISALRPNHVTIGQDGLVKIGMYNGWYDLGVRMYPEGYPEYPPPFKYGDRKLLEGLWYYDEGYRTHAEAYDKIVDNLLSKNQKLKKVSSESDPNSERSGRQTSG